MSDKLQLGRPFIRVKLVRRRLQQVQVGVERLISEVADGDEFPGKLQSRGNDKLKFVEHTR
ncbi:MAG TPA: hypothetical protein VJ023_11310 [Pyrinomonadaceae bacterium]|nr:hypothetical protein [Pyrinomonadaceae bacterium]